MNALETFASEWVCTRDKQRAGACNAFFDWLPPETHPRFAKASFKTIGASE